MAELKELAEFYARAAAMKDPVFRLKGFVQDRHVPTISSDMSMWTAEERQPDFQCLIDSGIDCEFSIEGESWCISKLKTLRGGALPYEAINKSYWVHCRPRLNHVHAWIATEDSKCPVPEGYEVKVYLANKSVSNWGCPQQFSWNTLSLVSRTVSFEVREK